MTQEQYNIIEAAYWAGFEPSSTDLTPAALLSEAQNYLTITHLSTI